jgi:hypothetical protein
MASFVIAWGLWVVGGCAGLQACHAETIAIVSPIALVSKTIHHHLIAIDLPPTPGGGGGSRRAYRPAAPMCQRAKPFPHRHRLSHRYQYVHSSITHCWFPQGCSVTLRQQQLLKSKCEMKKVRKRFHSFNLQISHSHHDFFCTFGKLFIFDAHVKLLQNQPPPD